MGLFALSPEFTVCTREHPDFTGPLRRDGSGHREMIVDFPMDVFWGLRIVVQDVAASFLTRCLRQPYLRPRRCGDLGFVSRLKPAEHHTPEVPAAPDVEASCITSCRGRRASFSTRRCGVTVCLQLRRSYFVLPCFFLRE